MNLKKKDFSKQKKLQKQFLSFGKPSFPKQKKLFIDSFRLKSNFLYILFYDLLFYIIAVPLFLLFTFILNKKSESFDPGILSKLSTITNVTAAQTQELQLATQSMQNFLTFFIAGIILLIIITLLAFTLSRTLIWNHLLKKKFNTTAYLKFNILNIILGAIFAIIILLSLRLRTAIITPLLSVSLTFAVILSSLLFLIMYLIITYFVSLVYINYTNTAKIFSSFKKTFKLIKTKFSAVSISYLFILIGAVIISLLTKLIWFLPAFIQRYFNIAVILIFLAWMRIYIVNVIKNA